MAEVACPTTDDLFELVRRVRALPGVHGAESYPYFKLLRQQFRWIDGGDRAAAGRPEAAREPSARRRASSTTSTGGSSSSCSATAAPRSATSACASASPSARYRPATPGSSRRISCA